MHSKLPSTHIPTHHGMEQTRTNSKLIPSSFKQGSWLLSLAETFRQAGAGKSSRRIKWEAACRQTLWKAVGQRHYSKFRLLSSTAGEQSALGFFRIRRWVKTQGLCQMVTFLQLCFVAGRLLIWLLETRGRFPESESFWPYDLVLPSACSAFYDHSVSTLTYVYSVLTLPNTHTPTNASFAFWTIFLSPEKGKAAPWYLLIRSRPSDKVTDGSRGCKPSQRQHERRGGSKEGPRTKDTPERAGGGNGWSKKRISPSVCRKLQCWGQGSSG